VIIIINRIVAIIPARRDSKRLEGKNKRLLMGKPLICWTIECAMTVDSIDEIIVTTNDDDIIEIAQQYWRDGRIKIVRRPEELALDDSNVIDVIFDAIDGYGESTIVILLQPTSPLRTSKDIEDCLKIYIQNTPHRPVVSFTQEPWSKLNGVVYVASLGFLNEYKMFMGSKYIHHYLMDPERSIDIDTIEDFEKVENFMKKKSRVLEMRRNNDGE
jgi:CMP-N-acetylneuraminic acid synthetase